ncbi:37036_t:CDS:2, partial [Gigaspora margarita]
DIWQYQDIKLDERVWYSNVTINTIEQYKNLDLIFNMIEGSWHLQENGPTIISMLDSKSEKQSKQSRIDLGLFFVKQLLDYSEELLINDTESRKVKEDFFSNDINTFTLQLHCEILYQTTDVNSEYSSHKRTRRRDKYTLLKYEDCNLNTKGKKNRCMISCNKNLIRDKPEYPLTPVQECPLLQLKEIDYAER